ncbi:ATP-binding protein [Kitasatospora sp. NPDC004669]|uniref:ATP-binding protein n=1 Tax=Kitasatospora sp. NPDC004669 TaxID=3154555 RepID=UPI0033A1DABF
MTAAVETPPRPPAAGSVKVSLPYEPQSAAKARSLVRTTLPGWGLEDLVEAGELVVRVLVGNAAKTGCRRRMTVTVERVTDRCVRISVRDGSRTLPCLVEAGPAAESGRGLALVHHLTGGHWGATLETFGKTVHQYYAHPRSQPGVGPPAPRCAGAVPYSSRSPGVHHHSDDEEVGMDIDGGHGGGGLGGGGGEGDGHPGTPWTPPSDPPSPDGTTPPGDGGHRK